FTSQTGRRCSIIATSVRQCVVAIARVGPEYVDKGRTILGYELVMPWTPTEGLLGWFRGVAAGAEFPTYWHGAMFVDGLASDYPAICDRFDKGDDVLDQRSSPRP
ncbi:MAG: hypothetical protein ACRDTJ_28355, partial [Pseudonocardiaceae bacterium]